MRCSKKFDGGQGDGEDAFLAFLQAVEDNDGRLPIRPAMARTSVFGKSETYAKRTRFPFLNRLFALIILCTCLLFLSSLSIFSMVEEENIPKVKVFTRRSIASPLAIPPYGPKLQCSPTFLLGSDVSTDTPRRGSRDPNPPRVLFGRGEFTAQHLMLARHEEMSVHTVLWHNTAQVQAALNGGVDMIIMHAEDEIEALAALAGRGKHVLMPNSTALDLVTDRINFQRWMMDAGFKDNLPLVWERVWKRYIPYPVVVKVSTSWDRNSGLPGTIMAWNKAQFETLSKRLDGVDWHMEESVKGREEYAIHFVAVHGVLLDAFECSSFTSHVSQSSAFIRDHRIRPFKDTFRNCSGLPHSADVATLLSSFTVATCYHGFGVLRYKTIPQLSGQQDEPQNATFKIVALRAGVCDELNEAPERLAPMIVEFWRAYRRQSKSPGSLASRLRGHLARGKYVVGNPPSSLSLRKQMLRTALSIDNGKATSSKDVDATGTTYKERPPGNLSIDAGVEMDDVSAAVDASSGNQTATDYLPMSSIGLPFGDTMIKVTNKSEDGRKGSDQAASASEGEDDEDAMDDDEGASQDQDSYSSQPSSSIGRMLSAVGNSHRLWNEWHLDDVEGDDAGTKKLDPGEDDAHFDNDTDDDDDDDKSNDDDEEDEDEGLDPRDETAIGRQQFWVFRRGAEGKAAEEEEEEEEEEEGASVMRDDAEEDAVDVQGRRHGYFFGESSSARFREFMRLEQDWDHPRESSAPINHHHDLPDDDADGAEEYYIGLETVLRHEKNDESEDDEVWEDDSPVKGLRDEGEDDEIQARIIAHEYSRRGYLRRPDAEMTGEEDGNFVGVPGLMDDQV